MESFVRNQIPVKGGEKAEKHALVTVSEMAEITLTPAGVLMAVDVGN